MSAWMCDWTPDDLNPGPDCPYCAGEMCGRFDGLGCTHDRIERHGYGESVARPTPSDGQSQSPVGDFQPAGPLRTGIPVPPPVTNRITAESIA